MFSGVANIISTTITYDEIGQSVITESARQIFCDQRSITRKEWADAGRQGLNPEILLVTLFANYQGEEIVEYNGVRYSVYRTYTKGDNIELYLERKGGVDA